jgi:hypothetical protein
MSGHASGELQPLLGSSFPRFRCFFASSLPRFLTFLLPHSIPASFPLLPSSSVPCFLFSYLSCFLHSSLPPSPSAVMIFLPPFLSSSCPCLFLSCSSASLPLFVPSSLPSFVPSSFVHPRLPSPLFVSSPPTSVSFSVPPFVSCFRNLNTQQSEVDQTSSCCYACSHATLRSNSEGWITLFFY